MRQVLTLFVSTFSTLLAIINPLEADANRLSVGEFWRSISFADLKDHAIKNYLKRITDRTKGVIEVPYKFESNLSRDNFGNCLQGNDNQALPSASAFPGGHMRFEH